MALSRLEGELLLVHGLRVELRQRVRGATKGRIQRPIHLVEPRCLRFPLPRHGFVAELGEQEEEGEGIDRSM